MIFPGKKANILYHVKVTHICITDKEVTFFFDKYMKNTRPNYKQKPLVFRAITLGRLCPVTTMVAFFSCRILMILLFLGNSDTI